MWFEKINIDKNVAILKNTAMKCTNGKVEKLLKFRLLWKLDIGNNQM